MKKLVARSASDRTDDWPFWMVWNGNMNVTGRVAEALGYGPQGGTVFASRKGAEILADAANEKGIFI